MIRLTIYITLVCLISTAYAQNTVNQDTTSQSKNDSTSIPEVFTPEYQQVNEEEIKNIIDHIPPFDIYLDNYFTTGIPVNEAVTPHTADAKYQISFRHRITKTVLPLNTALFLTYTQRSFWNIYEKSLPFKDSNFNPGLALSRHLTYNDKLWGIATVAFEHESNGRDSIYSRSWNYMALTVTYFMNSSFSFNGKLWLGFLAEENRDLFDYKGLGFVAANYRSKNDIFRASATINPRKSGKLNTILEVSFRPFPSMNQYFFVQWYQGYAENLLDYNQYTSKVRIGICIKPAFRNFY